MIILYYVQAVEETYVPVIKFEFDGVQASVVHTHTAIYESSTTHC